MSQSTASAAAIPGAGSSTARAAAALRGRLEKALGSGERGVDRRNALTAFAVRVASAAILLLSQVGLARWLGAAEYGVYVYAWTLLLVLGGIATVGLNIGALRIVSELRETAAHSDLRGFLRGSRLLVLLVGTVLAICAWHAADQLSVRFPSALWNAVAVVLLAVPAYALSDLQDGIGRGWARMGSALIAPYILRPLMILTGIGILHAIAPPLGAPSAILVAVCATWLAWAIQTCMIERDRRTIVPAGPRSYRATEWTRLNAPLLLMGSFDLAMQHSDIIVISNLLSPTDAGIYFAAAKTMALILFVHYAVGSAMANRFAAHSARGDSQAMRAAVRDAVRWTFWPSLILAVLMLAAGRPLLSLFGPQFVEGYPVLGVLAVAVLVRSSIGPAETLLTMSGGQGDCARALIIAALSNVVLSILLAPLYGILGAAIAVAVAMLIGTFLNWRTARRRLGFDIGIWASRAG